MVVARGNGVHTLGFRGLLQVPLWGEMMVAGAQVVGRPRKAAKTETNNGSLLKLMSVESVMPSNHLILCHPLLLLPLIFPSIEVFSKESGLHIRWPKYWSFSFSISPCSDSGLISFRMDWLDLLAVQEVFSSVFSWCCVSQGLF